MADRTFIRPLYFLAAAVLLASCSFSLRTVRTDEEKRGVARAVESFHQRYNAEQYGEIYDEADSFYKDQASRAAVVAGMKEARDQTGKILRVRQHWEKVFDIKNPVEVRAIYNVTSERGDFEEWFSFAMSDDGRDASLTNYSIHPGSAPPEDMEQMK
jgi:hypothetical protein